MNTPMSGSENALTSDPRDFPRELARGISRALAHRGFATLLEVSLANGRRADVLALGRDGELIVVEIKSSVADFKSDRKWRNTAISAIASISPYRLDSRPSSFPRNAA
jgi:hypothetical protein